MVAYLTEDALRIVGRVTSEKYLLEDTLTRIEMSRNYLPLNGWGILDSQIQPLILNFANISFIKKLVTEFTNG